MPRYAAIDIGSNSVRMQAAEVIPGMPARILMADREVTRLGASVFESGRISEEAMTFVCDVLKRMVDAYRTVEVVAVRAVATSAVRDASNQAEFVDRASEALGTPVEIISGPEEARLIHVGVQSRWPHPKQRILIVDVGGGSAELIVSEKGEMKEGLSRPLGAVRLTEVFLKNDPPTDPELNRLNAFIDERLEPTFKRIHGKFDRVIATSATAAALVSGVNRIPRPRRDEADRLRARTTEVRKFLKELASRDLAGRKKMHGVGPRRAEIIVAGAAVFLRVLESLRLQAMYYSVAGVRDGVIADLAARGVGGEASRLTRQQLRIAESMCRKYSVDLRVARHIARISTHLFENLQALHGLSPEHGKLLEAAAYLHDLGHYISDTGHHKHSAYVVMNSDMPGYTDQERLFIALLCRYHRKSMPAQSHVPFQSLTSDQKRAIILLTPLLRLAVGLEEGNEQRIGGIECRVSNGVVKLNLRGEGDLDLEMWAAERAAEIFRQVYGVSMNVERPAR
jgi:exopolyphosphatase/guanosine-5'-triphosphate,3'-diphosphate pyrophosphatase